MNKLIVGIASVVLAAVAPWLVYQQLDHLPALANLFLAVMFASPFIALGSAAAGLYVALKKNEEATAQGPSVGKLLSLSVGSAIGLLLLLFLGGTLMAPMSTGDVIVTFLMLVHVTAPLVALAAAVVALVMFSQKDLVPAKYFGSLAMTTPLFMLFVYGMAYLT